jgi:methylmalonyl-CoA/ethylmalonyl-CoA epimerase
MTPPVTLTYLDAGNALIQLVTPREECSISQWLDANGDGLHHVCFGVVDVIETVKALSDPSLPTFPLSSGRGHPSGFVSDGRPHGVLIECTELGEDDKAVST